MKNIPTTKSYKKLIETIASVYERARLVLVESYWEIGRLIIEEEQKGKGRAEYGTHLIERLSYDLSTKYGSGFAISNLRKMRQFYCEYPIRSARSELTWTHYRLLIQVENKTTRNKLEKRVVREKLSSRELESAIKEISFARPKKSENLKYTRGELYSYTVKEITLKGNAKRLVLDCGFSTYHDTILDSYRNVKKKDAFTSYKKGNAYSLKKLTAKDYKANLFTYKAYIERIIDGDTLWVYIPLGFGLSSRQKVRLRGIDTPELKTKEGVGAKRFVERTLSKSNFIIIKTHGRDKYDRYIADLFYLPNEKNAARVASSGAYLNQDILDYMWEQDYES